MKSSLIKRHYQSATGLMAKPIASSRRNGRTITIRGSNQIATADCAKLRGKSDVYLTSAFLPINNSQLCEFSLFLSLSFSLALYYAAQRMNRADSRERASSLIKRVSIIHAFAKLGLVLQYPIWPAVGRARTFDRSINRSSDYQYCFSRNDHTSRRTCGVRSLHPHSSLYIFHALLSLSSFAMPERVNATEWNGIYFKALMNVARNRG